MTDVLIKGEICAQRHVHREHNVKVKADTGVMSLQAKNAHHSQQTPETGMD